MKDKSTEKESKLIQKAKETEKRKAKKISPQISPSTPKIQHKSTKKLKTILVKKCYANEKLSHGQ